MTTDELFLLRRKKKIKLREIAEYVGCCVSNISQFERDKYCMSNDKLKRYEEFIINYQVK